MEYGEIQLGGCQDLFKMDPVARATDAIIRNFVVAV
jgi:hypothetical protein